MKKTIAIFLFCIHMFNLVGQLAFHQYMVYQSDKLFVEQASKNRYNTSDLTEIKIPVNMPGVSDWNNYENLTGLVKFEDAAYNYVKIKVTRTAIHLMCIPNYSTTQLSSQNIIYAGKIKDIPVPKKDHVPFGKINILAYNYPTLHYEFSIPIVTVNKLIYEKYFLIPDSSIPGPGQPPDTNVIFC